MAKADNRCKLLGFEGQPHGFFNFGCGNNRYYVETVRAMDEFLATLGYVEGAPTIENPQ